MVAYLGADRAVGEPVLVPDEVAADVLARAREIAGEADTMRLPSKLIPGAEAVADAAYLLKMAIEEGSVRSYEANNPIQETLDRLAVSDGDVAEDIHVSAVEIGPDQYQTIVDYVFRAVKLLREPAAGHGADTTVLMTVFPEDRE